MNYSRATLNSDWHKKREAEPKDYDFTTCCDGEKKSHRSTYKRLGTCLDADWITTAQMYQYPSKKECDARETPKLMVQADCFNSLVFDRITGPLHFMCTSVLPCQSQGYGQRELSSMYKLDFLPPQMTTPKASCLIERKVDFRRH